MSDKFCQKADGTNDTIDLRHKSCALASQVVITAYLLFSIALLLCCQKASFVGVTLYLNLNQ